MRSAGEENVESYLTGIGEKTGKTGWEARLSEKEDQGKFGGFRE